MLELTGTTSRNFLFALANGIWKHQKEFSTSTAIVDVDFSALTLDLLDSRNAVDFYFIFDMFMGRLLDKSAPSARRLFLSMVENPDGNKVNSWEDLKDEGLELKFWIRAYKETEANALLKILKDYHPRKGKNQLTNREAYNYMQMKNRLEIEGLNMEGISGIRDLGESFVNICGSKYMEYRVDCEMPTNKKSLDCFIDILMTQLTKEELLKKYGEETLRQFIGRYSDPFIYELLEEKENELKELHEITSNVEYNKMNEIEFKFIGKLKKLKKQMNSQKNPRDYFNSETEKLEQKYKQQIEALNLKEWERLTEVLTEIETIREGIR